VLGPIGENDSTPFLFAFDSIAAAEEVDKQFAALVLSLSGQQTLPAATNKDFALEGYKINLSSLVSSSSSPRSLAPTRFDRGFFRPSTWPDTTLGGIFPGATQDDMNDVGNFLFVLQPTVYEPYQFWLLAGTPDEWGYFEDGKVLFNEINGIAVDTNGNIYVADQGNHVIRKISIDNKVTTVAGQKWSDWSERQALEEKYWKYPSQYPTGYFSGNIGPITVDGNGTVFFVNGPLISKLTTDGKLSNLAGNAHAWWEKSKDGFGMEGTFSYESRKRQSMAVDKNGNLYLCDINAIRKITPAGQVTTLAGKLGWDDSEGYVDGAGALARFNDPTGVAVDDAGVVYVMDSDNFVIRKIQPNGTTSTFVGNATISNHFDGKGTKARLNRPEGLTIDSSGNLYFADGSTIRKVKPDGTVTTLAGKLSPERGAFRVRGQMGIQEAAGEVAVFGEEDVTGLVVDRRGTLYASFGASIYEAESIAAPPSGTPFPTPVPLSTPSTKPTPTPTPGSPGPLLSDIDLTPSSSTIDVSNGPVDVVLALKTSAELFNLGLDFTNTSTNFNGYRNPWPFSGPIDKSYNLPFSKDTVPGLWTLTGLSYQTMPYGGDTIELNASQVSELYGNISFNLINPFISNDSTPPLVTSLVLLSSEANVSNGNAKIRCQVQISDDLSGFDWLSLSFRNAATNENLNPDGIGAWNSLIAVNGDLKTYEGTIEIPQGSTEGDWILQSIYVSDRAANGNAVPLTTELQAVKFTVSNTATNPSEPEEQYTPWPLALTLEKASVNVTDADQKVKIYLQIANDDIPVQYYISVGFRNKDDEGSFTANNFALVSGTVGNGIYEGELIIPRYAENGNHTVGSIWISDNQTPESKSIELNPNFFPPELRKTITVTGTQDVTAPVLQSVAVTPTSADTRNGTVSVTANLTITDDLSGLQEQQWSRAGALALRSPSGKEFLYSQFTWVDRISGTSTNGTYQVQFELPQYSEEGVWTIDYIELVDRNYNTRFLIPANLTAQQLAASTIQVQGWPRGWEQQSFTSADSTKGNATIQLSNLSFSYDDKEKVPTVATNPGNLTQNVTLTYNGTTTSPIDPGTYTVVAFMNHPDYKGRQVATMTISNPPPAPPAPAPAPAPSGGAPSGGGGGSAPEKSKKSKKSSDKKGKDKKSPSKKSDKKSSGSGGDSNKSGGKKKKK
jgi:sugar lactone lactonase YvrE